MVAPVIVSGRELRRLPPTYWRMTSGRKPFRVAVDAETSGRDDLEEEGNVPHRRERVADGENGLVVEGEFEATHDAWLDRVDEDLLGCRPSRGGSRCRWWGGHRADSFTRRRST